METEAQTTEVAIRKLETTALAWPDRARAITIQDQMSYDQATELIVEIVGLRKEVTEYHAPLKKKAHDAHKAIVDAEKKLLSPLQTAEGILKRAIGAWDAEQERVRREEQRRIEAEQRRADEEARLALATEAEENGASEEAVDEILATPVVKPAVVAAPTYERANGVSTSMRWRAEVTDLKVLCLAVAQGRASTTLVQANMTALNGMARAMKETFNVPGCRAISEATVSVRS